MSLAGSIIPNKIGGGYSAAAAARVLGGAWSALAGENSGARADRGAAAGPVGRSDRGADRFDLGFGRLTQFQALSAGRLVRVGLVELVWSVQGLGIVLFYGARRLIGNLLPFGSLGCNGGGGSPIWQAFTRGGATPSAPPARHSTPVAQQAQGIVKRFHSGSIKARFRLLALGCSGPAVSGQAEFQSEPMGSGVWAARKALNGRLARRPTAKLTILRDWVGVQVRRSYRKEVNGAGRLCPTLARVK